MEKIIIEEFKRGPFLIRKEKWDGQLMGNLQAYTKSGDWVGEEAEAMQYFEKFGITDFEKTEPEHCVCSIGFSPKEKKWYGWSHRAIFGFEIGHVVKKGDCAAMSGWNEEYLKDHPDDKPMPVGFEVKTLEDAKRCAIAFSSSVS